MARRRKSISRTLRPDPVYHSTLISMFTVRILLHGKKSLAQKIIYNALEIVQVRTQEDALSVLEKALRTVTPVVEVKARRVGGSIYQVPQEIRPERGITLAIRWLLQGAKSKKSGSFQESLAQEIIDASQSIGFAIKKKEEVHRMAEANKAFAHYKV